MAAVYRAYYALNRNPRVNSKGLNTSCVLGFTTTLYDLLRSQRPTHVGVAFDLQAPTFRHEMYAEYKANRDAMPEEIQAGLPWVKKMIEAFRIPILTCEGYEADDVIGTVSHAAEGGIRRGGDGDAGQGFCAAGDGEGEDVPVRQDGQARQRDGSGGGEGEV